MIEVAQLRETRVPLGIEQRELASRSGLSMPMMHRMEASTNFTRGTVSSLMKLIAALDAARVEFIAQRAASRTGRLGVRFLGPCAACNRAGPRDHQLGVRERLG